MRSDPERGFVALELVLASALLLLPVAALGLALPTWAERQSAARLIAREVARQAAGEGVCDPSAASVRTRELAAGLGLRPQDVSVELVCFPGLPLPRVGALELGVTVVMPAITLPALGSLGSWSWTARHREPLDPYRSLT